MNELFIYFVKINAALALFYILFRVFFSRDTFWVGRRIFLILAVAISVLYPLISLASWLESKEPVQIFIAEWIYLQEFTIVQEVAVAPATVSISWQQILLVLYIMVSVVFLTRFFVQLFSVLRWNSRSRKAIINNIPVRIVSENVAPFSFFKSIFVNPNTCTESELKEILAHENTHAQQWHSADVMLGEFLTIIFWANPFAWLLKREIRQNLEFLADNQVLKFGTDTQKYQHFLLNLALYSPEIRLTNSFLNISTLKNRIVMMNKSKTKKMGVIKYALLLPATFVLIFASNAETLLASARTALETKVTNTENEPDYYLSMGGENQVNGFFSGHVWLGEERNNSLDLLKSNLIVIDGVAMDRNFDPFSISPNDILHLQVFAGNSSEAIAYGERGKNGVIFFITKENGKAINSQNGQRVPSERSGPSADEFVAVASPQQAPPPPPLPVVNPDVAAQFPGGNAALMKFLADNVRYPIEAQQNGEEGRVTVQFLVNTRGGISSIQVVRGVSPSLDREAIRIVESMPNWIPGEHPRGQKVQSSFTLPIVFRLHPNSNVTPSPNDVVATAQRPTTAQQPQEEVIFQVIEKQPEFPGGQAALMKFLSDNIQYPALALENNVQGRVVVQFVIQSTGEITDVEVVRGVSPSLDREAIRIVQAMPNWIPGEQRGQKVNTRYTLPIAFRLHNENAQTQTAPANEIQVVGYGTTPARTTFTLTDAGVTNPLWVVDGVVMGKDFRASSLSPDDIDNITVLKGESATALYGEDGKNGVIMITMKN
jgi:TonB family protein